MSTLPSTQRAVVVVTTSPAGFTFQSSRTVSSGTPGAVAVTVNAPTPAAFAFNMTDAIATPPAATFSAAGAFVSLIETTPDAAYRNETGSAPFVRLRNVTRASTTSPSVQSAP